MTFRRMDFLRFEGTPAALPAQGGYTGEDGFEILVPAAAGAAFWERLMADERVAPIGLGARDSLRLEAGLPLYGHDLDETVSPIEAGLAFAVSEEASSKPAAYAERPGSPRELADGPARLRVGLRILEGRPGPGRGGHSSAPMAIAWASSPAAGSRPRSARPSPWGLFRRRLPAWEPACPWTCVAAVRRPKLAVCPLFRTATTAALESSAQGRLMRFSKDHEMGKPRGRGGYGRHHRLRRRSAGRHRVR